MFLSNWAIFWGQIEPFPIFFQEFASVHYHNFSSIPSRSRDTHTDGIEKKCTLSGGMVEIIPIFYMFIIYIFLKFWLHL